MKKNTKLKLFLFFSLLCQICFAQVDVVYSTLVWSDEFNTNGAIDSNKWFHQTQLPAGGNWFNGEVQHYTNRVTNSFVDSDFLNIVSKKEVFTDQGNTKQFTSARLNSKFAFKYGRVDVRAKIPIEAGTWPAIWMLGKNINEDGGYFDAAFGTVGWPACGEIDIMEHGIFPSQSVNYIQSALHTPSSFGNTVNIGGIVASDVANNYHTYSLNWSPNRISFLLDDVIYYTYNPTVKNANNWPFDLEQYILLNIAMGGIAGSIATNFTQSSMLIDYVRVYQNPLSSDENKLSALNISPNPTNDFINISTSSFIDKVEIYNLLGNLVLSSISNTNKIDISNLTKGIYLINIYSGIEKSVKKIIVD
ncbi:family 16 glycosylhydrolase [Flavobacterium sp.]|uniref:family 16 glycosylhydrolase n=1 Tax=Flavobacterium sp. TaxID=239 RepID=UPI00286E89D2|nr:family 16 glycosylhydrolase [Flavobacterium sp.]